MASSANPDIAVVDDFLDALTRADVESAGALLAPDVEWLNTGLPTLRGRRVLAALRAVDQWRISFDVVTHHSAATDAVVLNDRTDVLALGPLRTTFPVRGTFTVRDGRITRWDDQFSLRQLVTGFFRRR